MSFWVTVYRFSWGVLGILLFVGVLCIFLPQYNRYQQLEQKEAQLQEEIRREESLLNEYQLRQKRFRTEPQFVERVAHDMGMAKPDEVLFKFTDEE